MDPSEINVPNVPLQGRGNEKATNLRMAEYYRTPLSAASDLEALLRRLLFDLFVTITSDDHFISTSF